MDVSNLISSSVAAPAGKTGLVAESVKTAYRGNFLPAEIPHESHTDGAREQAVKPKMDLGELRGLVAQANEAISTRISNLKFTMAEGTNIAVVRIEDSKTGELIRQIPSEQMVALARALDNLKQGMILEEKA